MSQLFDIWMECTSSELQSYVRLCGGSSKITHKADRAQFLVDTLTDAEQVRRLWDRMDELSRKAVAAAYHNDGIFNKDSFVNQYGALPAHPHSSRRSWYKEPILFDLFIRKGEIPAEIMPLLADLVPPPERFQVSGLEKAPTRVLVNNKQLKLLRADRETAGLQDINMYLTLLSQKKIRISNMGRGLTSRSVDVLAAQLQEGDFYAEREKAEDAIIPHGLHSFCYQAGWVSHKGQLADEAMLYLASQDPALLLEAFETWETTGLLDALSRIKVIKGQRSRRVHLTNPSERRVKIVEALSWCPTGVWISMIDFYRAIKIWQFDCDLEKDGARNLYIGHKAHQTYGAWASGAGEWLLTTGLYINAVLMETLAAIGAIDIIYTYPDYRVFPVMAYYYDGSFYSRYDGLLFFRINPLGAYLFGQADSYTPAQAVGEALFSVSPAGEIRILKPESLTPTQRLLLDQIADEEGQRWQLSRSKLLLILDEKTDLEMQRIFLQKYSQKPLPPELLAWLDSVEADSRALRVTGRSLTIKVRSARLAADILAHPTAGKIARPLDARTLVIPASRENAFRKALREMGVGLKP